MSLTYCALFGLDESQRKARLSMSGLSPGDREALRVLHDSVLPEAAPGLTQAFADQLSAWPASAQPFASEPERAEFGRRSSRFLLELGRVLEDPRWFEERLRDTVGWARAGVSLPAYVCAMGQLQRLALEPVARYAESHSRPGLAQTLMKVFALELSLAGDSYQLVHTDDFRSAVDAMHAKLTADALTGVSTREHLLAMLKLRLHVAEREGGSVCVILADLDFFKRVNDNYGHAGGDAVLRQVADRMRASVREPDVVGRLGGEEFAIVLEGAGLAGAVALAERIRERVASQPCTHAKLDISVTLSQGVAVSTRGESLESLLSRADAALYAAKHGGRDRVVVHEKGRSGGAQATAGRSSPIAMV